MPKQNEKGFTLIEVMIVIAIIGILAGIAIPNFLNYRDKAYCSTVEADANTLVSALSDYFAIPGNQSFATQGPLSTIVFPGSSAITLSRLNTGTITQNAGVPTTYTFRVDDVSARCPLRYQAANPTAAGDPEGWSQATGGFFQKQM